MADDLFAHARTASEPLAARMRPRNLDEYIGQDHIVGKGRLLRRAIQADQLTSVIFYGPPGSGKTTLARVIANHTKSNFITLNAVLTGVADIRESIKKAEEYFNLYSRRTILFVDEVHRWNKSQQDALLPWVENGTIILIGATTEKPFFEVNKALVSRSRVFQLKALTNDDLKKAAFQAVTDKERGYGNWKIVFEDGALEHLVETANGDARSLLNALELAVETTPEKWAPKDNPPVPAFGSEIYISSETAEESIQKKVVLYDKDGDYHYDIISAFIKSLRGRDPDAAMYWMARMVLAGEDPHFIFRRMMNSACEDTGLADPNAISVVESCAAAFDRVGLPEGRYFLAHAALYLATAPKSNSSMAFFDALSAVEKEDCEVPNHLRDANRDAEGFGHGNGYLYPHAYRDHWVAQQYLPGELMGRVFYTPSTQGYEGKIRSDVLSRRELQIASILEESTNETGGENLTFSPEDKSKENNLSKADKFWQKRLDSNRAEVLLKIRDEMIENAELLRHHRNLIWNADSGLLLWEIARRTPEGVTFGVCKTCDGKTILEKYGETLGELDRPVLVTRNEFELAGKTDIDFDRLFYIDPFSEKKQIDEVAEELGDWYTCADLGKGNFGEISKNEYTSGGTGKSVSLADGWKMILSQKILCHGQRISDLIKNQILCEDAGNEFSGNGNSGHGIVGNGNSGAEFDEILSKMEEAENEFFEDESSPLFSWDADYIKSAFENKGFLVEEKIFEIAEKKRITVSDIERWFDTKSSYGKKIFEKLGSDDFSKVKELFLESSEKKIFDWKSEVCLCIIKAKE